MLKTGLHSKIRHFVAVCQSLIQTDIKMPFSKPHHLSDPVVKVFRSRTSLTLSRGLDMDRRKRVQARPLLYEQLSIQQALYVPKHRRLCAGRPWLPARVRGCTADQDLLA